MWANANWAGVAQPEEFQNDVWRGVTERNKVLIRSK